MKRAMEGLKTVDSHHGDAYFKLFPQLGDRHWRSCNNLWTQWTASWWLLDSNSCMSNYILLHIEILLRALYQLEYLILIPPSPVHSEISAVEAQRSDDRLV
jgi:hypothetical protein